MPRDHVGLYPVSSQMGFSRGIILLDDAEGTFNWTVTGTGSDFAASYETDAAFMGTKGIKLVTKTTTPAENDSCQIERFMPYPEADLLTMRMRCCLPLVSNVKYVMFSVYTYDGERLYQAEMLWQPKDGGVYMAVEHLQSIEIPGSNWEVVNGAWVTMEFTVNLKDKKYISAMFNGTRADMSAHLIEVLSASTKRYMRINAKVVADGAAQTTIYCDFIYAGEYVEL